MDNILSVILVVILSIFSGIGMLFTVGDFRYFESIEKQCKQQGYIQNKVTRITCKVEV